MIRLQQPKSWGCTIPDFVAIFITFLKEGLSFFNNFFCFALYLNEFFENHVHFVPWQGIEILALSTVTPFSRQKTVKKKQKPYDC